MNVEVLYLKSMGNRDYGMALGGNNDQNITVRFIGEPLKLFQYFFSPEPKKPDLEEEGWKFSDQQEAQLHGAKPKLNFRELIGDRPWVIFKEDNFEEIKDYKPVERLACFVIDKNDEDKLKVFASPMSVISQAKSICGKEPMGEFTMQVTRLGRGMNTRYEVRSLGRDKLTLDEEKMVNGTCPTCTPIDILVHNKEVEIIYEEYEEIDDRMDILDL